MKTKSILPLLAWCATLIPVAQAHQPHPVDVQIVSRPSAGGRGAITLTNSTRQMVTLVLSPGNLATVPFSPVEITLSPLAVVEKILDTPAMADGIQAFHVSSRVTAIDLERVSRPGPGLHEVLRVSRGSIEKISYEEAYLTGRRSVEGASETAEIPLGDGAVEKAEMPRQAFNARPVGDVRLAPLDLPEPSALLGMKPRQTPEAGDASYLEPTKALRAAAAAERMIQPDNPNDPNDPNPGEPSSMTITGTWVVRLPTGFDSIYTHEAGWGWSVRAWQFDGGSWRYRGSTTVGSTGTFKLKLAHAIPGLQTRILFQSQNRFVNLTDASGTAYSWAFSNHAPSASFDIGKQMADLTANGDAPGIYYLFNGAVRLWTKFSGYGVNVLRDQPIQVTYPNTLESGQCVQKDDKGVKYPWSCAYWDTGKIWIIGDHADSTVVQHEIAHSINAYYWGELPADAGGKHNLTDCFTPGLAMTEGFANFIAYWVKVDRGSADPNVTYLGAGFETTDSGVCTGSANETRAGAMFWDAHDTHADGPGGGKYDNWYFTKAYAVPVIYLNNPSKSVLDFQKVYKNILGSAWETPIDNAFRLNRLIW